MQTKALALAAQGFEVFPLIPHGKPPAIKDWQHKATADPATIKLWWPEGSVKNIGIHCKDLCVIDVDVKKTNGYVEFKKLPVSPTKISQTTSGGCHVLYRLPAGTKIKNQVNFRPGIDIRTEGGFIVAPGSIINNKEYFWANDRPVAMIPLPLLELLSPGATAANNFGHVPVSAALTGKVPAGSRDDMVYKMCCSWRAQNLTWEQAGVKLGELWPSIEQPPDDPFTWAEACAKLTQAWRHPAGTAATQLAAQITPELETPADTAALDLKEMVKRFVLIENGSFVGDLRTRLILKLSEFKTAMKPFKIPREGDRGPLMIEGVPRWLEFPTRQTTWDTVYYPDEKAHIKTIEKLKYFNTYRGPSLPVVTCNPAIIAPFMDHLLFLTGGRQALDVLLDWLAFSVQYPWKRITWAYMIVTPKYGVGKNPLFLMMQRVMGKQNVGKIDERDLDSSKNGFTGFMSGKTMLLVDECEGTAYEELKDFVTDNSRSINHKYGAMRQEDLYCSVLLFTNKADSLKLPIDDRRFYIAACYQERKQDLGYYTSLFESLEDDVVPAHFLAFLKARDVSKFGWNRAPVMTDAKKNMVAHSMTYAQTVIEDMFEDAQGPCMFDIITPKLAHYYLRSDSLDRNKPSVTMSDITRWLGPHYLQHPLPNDQYRLSEPPVPNIQELNTRRPRLVCIRNRERWMTAPNAAIKLEYLRALKATVSSLSREQVIAQIQPKKEDIG